MNGALINETGITKGVHSANDSVSLGDKVLKVTVKNIIDSASNVYVGWNKPASQLNTLQPGESATYYMDGFYLDKNKLYVAFDDSSNTGQALVSVIFDSGKEVC